MRSRRTLVWVTSTPHAAVLQALVLAAQALVVLDGAEDLGAEKSVTLWFESAVVDGLGLLHLAKRPRTDLLWRSQTDLDRVEVLVGGELLEKVQKSLHANLLDCCVSRA
jgi:hypothetical protein